MSCVLRRLCLGVLCLLATSPMVPAALAASDVVVSQVYGGGGNSGATFRNDFVELFNRGGAPIDVAGWSVQYASSAGSTWQRTNLSGVIPPGGYYLVQEAQGAGGTVSLPTPDASGTIAMSATAGKVALVRDQTTIGSGTVCPSGGTLVDLVGFGGANCFEGGGPTGALGNLTAALRLGGGCSDSDSNSADFTTGAPTPRNSAAPAQPCLAPTAPTGHGSASPARVIGGSDTLLTVAVTLGAHPPSTGVQVSVDLAPIGGSAQPLADDGLAGDAVANDLVFSYRATVGAGTTPGAKTLAVTVRDAELRQTATTIAVTVAPPPVAVHEIQGSADASPLVGVLATTRGIVTGLRANGFYLQTPDAEVDADPTTSEGVFVFTGSTPPPAAALGAEVVVTGTVAEFSPASDPTSPPLTEIGGGPTVTLLSDGHPLPEPVTLTPADVDPAGGPEALERYEGMRVRVDSLTVVGPTEGFLNEPSATATSNGVFYGVLTGTARPFREPGLDPAEAPPPEAPCCVPRFDGNPERLKVDSDGLTGAARLDVAAGDVLLDVTGPLDYSSRTYALLPDPGRAPFLTARRATPLPDPAADEFTIGSYNLERFFDTSNDPAIAEPVLTASAFETRLAKASLAVRRVLRMPDILGLQEVENLSTIETLAERVNADAVASGAADPAYVGYLLEGNDVGGIDVGVLVKTSRVSVLDVAQEGKDALFVNPVDGASELLNDRPPLVVRARVRRADGPDEPVTLVVNHLRSLRGIDDPADGARVRAKRRAQAEFLAELIQARQTADPREHVVALGDFNAFPFNDGFVDSVGTVLGRPTPPDEVVLASGDLVEPDLVDASLAAPAADRYSYVFGGSAQQLDQVLITANLAGRLRSLRHAHLDADFPEVLRNDPSGPERLSDHDPVVAYFALLDQTPPRIEQVAATPSTLWPPFWQLVPVRISVVAADASGPPACRITGVSSNEPLPSWWPVRDWYVTGDLSLLLRAARSGRGRGRTYTISVACTDAAGNTSTGSVKVLVPKHRPLTRIIHEAAGTPSE